MPRIGYLKDVLNGLTAYLYFKDQGDPHVVVRKGSGKTPDAEVKFRIETLEVMDVYGFSETAVHRILKSIRPYQKQLLEDWYEIQKK